MTNDLSFSFRLFLSQALAAGATCVDTKATPNALRLPIRDESGNVVCYCYAYPTSPIEREHMN